MVENAAGTNIIFKRLNGCRSTNFLINLKKNKGYIGISLFTILIISVCSHLIYLANNNMEINSENVDNYHLLQTTVYNLKNTINNLKLNHTNILNRLEDTVKTKVPHEIFKAKTNGLASNFGTFELEMNEQSKLNYGNISLIASHLESELLSLQNNMTALFKNLKKNISKIINTSLVYQKGTDNSITEIKTKVNNNITALTKDIKNINESYHKTISTLIEITSTLVETTSTLIENNSMMRQQINGLSDNMNKTRTGYKIYIASCPKDMKEYGHFSTIYLCGY